MFQVGQIFTSTEVFKNYRRLVTLLDQQPQPILITHKSGERFVLMPADLFEEMLTRMGGESESRYSLRQQVLSR